MNFWKKFEELCKMVGKSPNAVAKELGISSGAVTFWKQGRIPHQATLEKLAKYFNVTINYFYDNSLNLNNSKAGNIEQHHTFTTFANPSTLLEHNIDPAKVSNPPLNDDVARDEYEKELLAIYRCLSTKEKNALLNKAYELSELFKS